MTPATGPAMVSATQDSTSVPRVAPPAAYDVSPPLAAYTDAVLFGDNWERPQLSPRDRSLVTLSTLITNGRVAQLRGHLGRAIDNGVTPREISEVIAHLAFYAGWPVAISAVHEAKAVFDERGIGPDATRPSEAAPLRPDAQRRGMVDNTVVRFAPRLAAFTEKTLFGDLWCRPDLAPRDRSLITIVALLASGEADQLPFPVTRAMEAGLTESDLGEVLTHAAFYGGWPRAMAALPVLQRILAERAVAARTA